VQVDRREGWLTPAREAALVAGCVALFVLLAAVRAWDHTHPYYDDVAFLDLGNRVRELGGPQGLLKALFAGTWLEDNRNPLYLGFLSLVAGRDHGYHFRARILTICMGAMALLACWWAARRHAGRRPALVFAAFLAASETLVDYSSRESAEPLLILLLALTISFMLDGLTRPRAWIAAGFFAGLAQLDKGNAVFVVFSFALSLLLWRGWKALRDPHAWGLGATFLATASPLLWRNLSVYGSPLHNWNTRIVWIPRLPDAAELLAPHAFDRLPHGFVDWLRHTSLHEVLVNRIGLGAAEVAVHLGDAMSFVAPRPLGLVHIPGVVLGFALLVVALRILWKAPPSFARTFLLVQAGVFIVFFWLLWSVAGGSSRYVFPATLPLYVVLAREMVARPAWLKRWSALGALCIALTLAFDPFPRRLPQGFDETQTWLERN
jgi:4-amino-4-deoxy-L-arabinose transferase-like glycosyltransferase